MKLYLSFVWFWMRIIHFHVVVCQPDETKFANWQFLCDELRLKQEIKNMIYVHDDDDDGGVWTMEWSSHIFLNEDYLCFVNGAFPVIFFMVVSTNVEQLMLGKIVKWISHTHTYTSQFSSFFYSTLLPTLLVTCWDCFFFAYSML